MARVVTALHAAGIPAAEDWVAARALAVLAGGSDRAAGEADAAALQGNQRSGADGASATFVRAPGFSGSRYHSLRPCHRARSRHSFLRLSAPRVLAGAFWGSRFCGPFWVARLVWGHSFAFCPEISSCALVEGVAGHVSTSAEFGPSPTLWRPCAKGGAPNSSRGAPPGHLLLRWAGRR